jgi:hypothetical protein
VALAIASLLIDVSVGSKLHEQIDASLVQEAQKLVTRYSDPRIRPSLLDASWTSIEADDGGTVYTQLVPSLGAVVGTSRDSFTSEDRRVAAGADDTVDYRDGVFRGRPARSSA